MQNADLGLRNKKGLSFRNRGIALLDNQPVNHKTSYPASFRIPKSAFHHAPFV